MIVIDLEVLLCYDNIPCRPLSNRPIFSDLELMAIEIHQNKRRWLFLGIYKPPPQSDNECKNKLTLVIYHYLPNYENLILTGDFNLSTENRQLDAVIQTYNLNNLIYKPTCFQFNNPTCIPN